MADDILQVQGINEKGFGIIPKLAMQDKRLTAEAKAIYAYFCSYAGAGRTAFPSRDKIISDLGISENRYYRHFDLLKQYGYIKVEREKPVKGKFKRNVYTLLDTVSHIQNEDVEEPYLQNTCMQNASIQNTCMQNEGTKINSIKNNSININSLSCQSGKADKTRQDETDEKQAELYLTALKDNIGYSRFTNPTDIALIDELLAIMLDAIMGGGKYIRIGEQEKSRAVVKSQLLKLNGEHITHVIDKFKRLENPVTRRSQYLLAMLYNIGMELESFYRQY